MNWGYHILVDCFEVSNFNDQDNITNFIDELSALLNSVTVGSTVVEHITAQNPNQSGISFFQMLEGSSITGRFVNSTKNLYLEVFSCSSFNPGIIRDLVEKYFGFRSIGLRVIVRNTINAVDTEKAVFSSAGYNAYEVDGILHTG